MSFESEAKRVKDELFGILESIDSGTIESNKIAIQIGGKIFSFENPTVSSEEDFQVGIKKDIIEKLNTQQSSIREKINEKMKELLVMYKTKEEEVNRKTIDLKRKLDNSALMPEISKRHTESGLSVTRSWNYTNGILYIYRAMYHPKFVDRKPMSVRMINRLKRPILIAIETKGNSVASVTTKTRDGFRSFSHYHNSGSQDCWGKWKHPTRFSSVDEILQIAKTAEAVLENVNTGSVAETHPDDMPNVEALKKSVRNLSAKEKGQRKRRMKEVFSDTVVDDEDVWTT